MIMGALVNMKPALAANAQNLVCGDNGLAALFAQAYSQELTSWAVSNPVAKQDDKGALPIPVITYRIVERDEPMPYPARAPLYQLFSAAIGGSGELFVFEGEIKSIPCELTVEFKETSGNAAFSGSVPTVVKIKGSYQLPSQRAKTTSRRKVKAPQRALAAR